MLRIDLPGDEWYDPVKNEFVYAEERVLHLEHSLFSISKWEAKWKKSFLSTKTKTAEETLDYIRCMADEDVSDDELARLTEQDVLKIEKYLRDPMTATTFGKDQDKGRQKKVTSEEIYYLMAANGIPFECERWNFNRLMTLLRICAIRGGKQKKMGKGEILKRQAALNAARRSATGSKG